MKKNFFYLAITTLLFSAIFLSCKKNQSETTSENTTQVTVQTDDQSRLFAESEAVSNDVNTAMESSSPSITGRETNIQSLICDATVATDIVSNPKTITITYNGANCQGNRSRTGVVTISIAAGMRWKNAGAVISVAFKNLKVTRLSDNKSVTINGTHTITNVSGGLLINLPNLQSITHTITSSNMSVTFDDGSQRTWQVARQHVFTYNNGIVISITGIHTEGNNKGIEEWGSTRFGNVFTNYIPQPIVIRQDCSFRVVSGTMKHETALATTTVTFGLDVTGKATSCPGAGNYYLKAEWMGVNGKIITLIYPY